MRRAEVVGAVLGASVGVGKVKGESRKEAFISLFRFSLFLTYSEIYLPKYN